MSQIKKAIFFGLLFLTATMQLVFGKPLLGITMILLSSSGLMIFEKREANRAFYKAMTKLLVCADMESFRSERTKLVRHALLKRFTREPVIVLNRIEAYYSNHVFEMTAGLEQHSDYAFWLNVYDGMSTRSYGCLERAKYLERKIPSYFSIFAKERVDILDAFLSGGLENFTQIRSGLKANLHIAEVTGFMAEMTNDPKIKAYYVKSAENISRGLIKKA